jgi:hypothetical protein
MRAGQQARRDHAETAGEDTTDLDQLLDKLDEDGNSNGHSKIGSGC